VRESCNKPISPDESRHEPTTAPLVFTNRGMSPPPQTMVVEQPPGVPALSWGTDPMTNGAPDIDSVDQ
jgi:hypothetical protein